MRPSGANSISARLTRLNLLVTGMALLLACLAFLAYDFFSYRDNLIQNLFSAAQITGTNSVTALMFDDPQAAASTLNGLRNSPDVISAAIVTQDGHLFANYQRADATSGTPTPALRPGSVRAEWTQGGEVLVGYQIMFSGKSVGTVYILARFSELGHRLRRYGLIVLVIFLLSIGAATLLTAAFRRMVTEPITRLAGTARMISREKDYALRAEKAANEDEIATLVDAFNDMLQEIQTRDGALAEARGGLERRVQERTAELRAANKELESFSYSVAHDLRGPLDVISGMSYVIQSTFQEKLGAEGAEMLETIQRSSRSMATLIDDLLNLARATTVGLERKQIDLTAMAQSVAEDLVIANPERRVQFTIAEGALVDADQGLMSVVMDNLIRNAWKYTSRHARASIEFAWTVQGGRRIYFVRDDGAGFDSRKASRLFQPFQRMHSSSEFPGTGIGLATVQRIIARHGGRVWAEGKVEHGATFYFTI
ncbi:MAG: ATP-binding protein [Acidobacteriaceae bacterium]